MTEKEQKQAAKQFAEFWKDKGYEKGQSQTFWLQLLSQVYGIERPEQFIEFEDQVHIDKNTGFIDGYIPTTKVLIEQKSIDKDLRKGIRQSDGSLLNPFQQAKKYIAELPLSKHPKWVITCNFKSFLIYNMENPNGEPEEIFLKDLEKEYYRLQFIVDKENENLKKEMEISIQAGELVGKIYDEILPLYKNPENVESLKSLNMLCVRLVFCLYAEDAGLFGKHQMFHDYLKKFETKDLRRALIDLFKVLDQKPEERDPYLDEELASFPYVNGGLFADEDIEIPNLNDKVKELLLTKASEDFDWSDISPTIFGAVFESTLNPETRRSGGMHYTSIENIHKVIDPLFLNDLKAELDEILSLKVLKTKKEKIYAFQEKISKLKFLDPACGSGNFLTETYLSLRRLENKGLDALQGGQIGFGDANVNPIKVSIGQFYGIEINDFAVTVAKTALWIAESQMMHETEEILHMNLDFLPLKSYTNIIEGNALRIDWNDVVDKNELNYIMGNPPFVGYKLQNEFQKEDLQSLNIINKNIDYVAGWYYKAVKYIENTFIKVAFVSTNSITQGEQVEAIWKELIEKYKIVINFAYRTFRWDSEAHLKAHVHCVIIGFSMINTGNKYLFSEDNKYSIVNNISPYLVNSDNIFIEKRNKPINDGMEIMVYGSEPREGGYLLLSQDERDELLAETPKASEIIRRFVSSEDFINNKYRYCLWFQDTNVADFRSSLIIKKRLELCRSFREQSKQKQAHASAEYPYLFASPRQPKTDYLLIPIVSSETRKYIPIGYMSKDIIVSNACFTISNATLYTFAILMSNVHMAWMRATCGRLEMRYRYSNTIVYNNFPFPNVDEKHRKIIEQTAQGILDARAKYSSSSLADLYDDLTMPPELRKAHQENDRAVMEAYGFDWRNMTESDCVAELMKMYKMITEK